MLITIKLLNIFVETAWISGFFEAQRDNLIILEVFCNNVKVKSKTVSFYQFHAASLLNKSINLFLKTSFWPQTLEWYGS